MTAERLARLDPAARFFVEVAGVTGPGCTPEHVLLLSAGDERAPTDTAGALTGLETATAAGLLERSGPLCFAPAHALLRDAVYTRLPAAQRLDWHRRLADAVESGALPGESVAHRLRAATDTSGRVAAVRACRAAAGAAAASLAFDRAAEVLDAALALPASTRPPGPTCGWRPPRPSSPPGSPMRPSGGAARSPRRAPTRPCWCARRSSCAGSAARTTST